MKAFEISSSILIASLLVTGISMPEAKAEYLRDSEGYPVRDGFVLQIGISSSFLTANKPDRGDGGNNSDRGGGGKNGRHGNRNAKPSVDRQIEELGEGIRRATGTDRKKLEVKRRNIIRNRATDKKGNTDHNGKNPLMRIDIPNPELPILPATK